VSDEATGADPQPVGCGDSEAVCAALADADARRVIDALETPLAAREVERRCDLPRTTVYRRLDRFSDARLVAMDIEFGEGGHHATRYVCDASDVVVSPDGSDRFAADAGEDQLPAESVDERLANRWPKAREEL
jgi:hypothetical protein